MKERGQVDSGRILLVRGLYDYMLGLVVLLVEHCLLVHILTRLLKE